MKKSNVLLSDYYCLPLNKAHKRRINNAPCFFSFFHRTEINVFIGTVNVWTYQVDTNAGVKKDISEMELNRVKSLMNANKVFTTATSGLPVSTRERVSTAAVRMALKATGVHVMI